MDNKLDKLVVVGDRVLIKPKSFSEKTNSGLYLPPGIQEKKETPEQIMDRFFAPLEVMSRQENWQHALASVFKLWEEAPLILSGVNVGTLPETGRLHLREIHGNMTLLRSMNLPAIVEVCRPRQDRGVYAVLKTLDDDGMIMLGKSEERIPPGLFYEIWYGHAYVMWKDFEDLPRVIAPGASSLSIAWLQYNLKTLDLFEGPVSGVYDERTREAVIRLQQENGLKVDGLVGPETKMILYARLDVYPKPTLRKEG